MKIIYKQNIYTYKSNMSIVRIYRKILRTAKNKYNWKVTNLPTIKKPKDAFKNDYHYCMWRDLETNIVMNAITTNVSGCMIQDNMTALLNTTKNMCLFNENKLENIIKLMFLLEVFEKETMYVGIYHTHKQNKGFLKL